MSQTPYKSEEEARFVALEEESANVQASQIGVLEASVAALVAASTHPVNLTAFRAGTLTDDTLFWIWPVGTSTHIPTQSAVGTALAQIASDGSATNIVLKHSASVGAAGSVIGNVKFPAAASAEGTVDVSSATVVAPGEFLWASVGQVTDAVIADIAFTIEATKNTN